MIILKTERYFYKSVPFIIILNTIFIFLVNPNPIKERGVLRLRIYWNGKMWTLSDVFSELFNQSYKNSKRLYITPHQEAGTKKKV